MFFFIRTLRELRIIRPFAVIIPQRNTDQNSSTRNIVHVTRDIYGQNKSNIPIESVFFWSWPIEPHRKCGLGPSMKSNVYVWHILAQMIRFCYLTTQSLFFSAHLLIMIKESQWNIYNESHQFHISKTTLIYHHQCSSTVDRLSYTLNWCLLLRK